MSLITGSLDLHSFVKLDKDVKPAMGQRLVRLIAKGAAKHVNLSESLAVSIPRVTQDDVADCIDRLLPHVVGLVQDAQDKIIREYRIDTGREAVPENVISMEECIAYLDATAAGDRVSSEYLSEWFAEEYREAAISFITSALELDIVNGEIPAVVEQKYNVLREMFAGWSSSKYSPSIPKLRAMIRFSTSVYHCDGRMIAMVTKSRAMLAKKESELTEDALGF